MTAEASIPTKPDETAVFRLINDGGAADVTTKLKHTEDEETEHGRSTKEAELLKKAFG